MTKPKSISELSIEEIIENLVTGDRVTLGKAITLVESRLERHQEKGDELLTALQKKKNESFRIAISGAPGVGKSTFIEALGVYLADQGNKVAVLSIDPSSDSHKGSILGDKTRMENLSIHDNAFIRPSPAGDFLGGTAWRTREAINLCEAAGYNIIFVETVGVGQSEFNVKHMVDCFLLLLSPAGGDDLQGIKRGIMEMADILAVTKSDGDLKDASIRTRKDYAQALHLFPASDSGWTPEVLNCSGITGEGIERIWISIMKFKSHIQSTSHFDSVRKDQHLQWFKDRLVYGVNNHVNRWLETEEAMGLLNEIKKGNQFALTAAKRTLKQLIG